MPMKRRIDVSGQTKIFSFLCLCVLLRTPVEEIMLAFIVWGGVLLGVLTQMLIFFRDISKGTPRILPFSIDSIPLVGQASAHT